METSVFIARLMGPVMTLAGLVIVLNPERMAAMGRELVQGEAPIFVSGIVTLVLGLTLVNTHNSWSADWRICITIFGWICVLAGVARMAFSTWVKGVGEQMIANFAVLRLVSVALIALGVFLSYQGYLS